MHPKNEKELLNFLIKKTNVTIKKCYPYGNYLTNFGIKYKHFKPHKFYKGYLNNQIVNHYGAPLNLLLSGLKKLINKMKQNYLNHNFTFTSFFQVKFYIQKIWINLENILNENTQL